MITTPLKIGTLSLPHRLIQGPLAGYSCAPFRELFYQFIPPAYCVSEMISAHDLVNKHQLQSRYLYKAPKEKYLAYQLSGSDPSCLAKAAFYLEQIGASLIDINCGCPKPKIRKKGAGSALLENPQQLVSIIKAVKRAISIPLTIKIRLHGNQDDLTLARQIEQAGADALIIHGRHWQDNYSTSCNLEQIGHIKRVIRIPVIANGDIRNETQLSKAWDISGCDAVMISRAGTGQPWLYQQLLTQQKLNITINHKIHLFMHHLQGLATLENEFKAVLQSKSLIRYYFKNDLRREQLLSFYQLNSLEHIHLFLKNNLLITSDD